MNGTELRANDNTEQRLGMIDKELDRRIAVSPNIVMWKSFSQSCPCIYNVSLD